MARNFLVIGRPHCGETRDPKGGNISGKGDQEKTSMQMDRPIEFSRGTFLRDTRVCVARACVVVNTGCQSPLSFVCASLSFLVFPFSLVLRLRTRGEAYSRKRAAILPAWSETKGKLTDVQWFSVAQEATEKWPALFPKIRGAHLDLGILAMSFKRCAKFLHVFITNVLRLKLVFNQCCVRLHSFKKS